VLAVSVSSAHGAILPSIVDRATEIKLTPTSFIVLASVARLERATPYELKALTTASLSGFWTLQHAALYAEPARLAGAGLLAEEREEAGRRRRFYTLTPAGRARLDSWLAAPTGALAELRDPGLLRLSLGAPPGPLAAAQLAAHEAKLAEYEALRGAMGDALTEGQRLTLEAGLAHERVWVAFWRDLAPAP
jgi:DNA-binding PadR family transcriptional regulator